MDIYNAHCSYINSLIQGSRNIISAAVQEDMYCTATLPSNSRNVTCFGNIMMFLQGVNRLYCDTAVISRSIYHCQGKVLYFIIISKVYYLKVIIEIKCQYQKIFNRKVVLLKVDR